MIASVVYTIYRRSQDCHGSWLLRKAGTSALTRTLCSIREVQLEVALKDASESEGN